MQRFFIYAFIAIIPCMSFLFVVFFVKRLDGGDARAQIEVKERDGKHAAGIKSLQQLAGSGDATAQCELGLRLYYGQGIESDEAAGIDLLQRSAHSADAYAQYRLRSIIETLQDEAASGDAPAQYRLGYMLCKGSAIAKDEAAGLELMNRAATSGNIPAQNFLKALPAQGKK